MAIRFACPSCRQPLEIDNAWGGQSVACPYCRRVVTAPQANTWPSGDIPMASPANLGSPSPQAPQSPGFAPPPPPGFDQQPGWATPRTSNSAGWAFGLTLAAAVVWFGLMFAWVGQIYRMVMSKVGPGATQAETQRAIEDLLTGGNPPRFPTLAFVAVVAMLASIGGLVLAVRSLVRREPRRGIAITACVLGALFMFCQLILLPLLTGTRGGN